MNVYLEYKLLIDTKNNHFKGINLPKEIIRFKKQVETKRCNEEFDGGSSSIVGSNSTQCARTQTSIDIRKQTAINIIACKKNEKFFSNNMLHRKAADDLMFGTTKKKAPNFKEYQAFLVKAKREEAEFKKKKMDSIKVKQYLKVVKHSKNEHNQNLVTEVNLYKDVPSATSIYSIIGKQKLELFKTLSSKVPDYGTQQAFNKPKAVNFVQINKKLPKVSANDKSIFCPIAYIPEKLFDTYSEANRYEKALHTLLQLKYNITNNLQFKVKTIKDFLFKIGFNLNEISSQSIINFDAYINQSNLTINPKLNLKSNILEILNGNLMGDIHNEEIKSKEDDSINIQNISKSFEHNNNLSLIKQGIISQEDKDWNNNYKVKSGPNNNLSVNTIKLLTQYKEKRQNDSQSNTINTKQDDHKKYQTVYKANKHELIEEPQNYILPAANGKKQDKNRSRHNLNGMIKDINTDLEKNDIKLDKMMNSELADEDHLSTQRIYQNSIKPIGLKINEAKILNNLNRNEFCKKKKLLEYVILKYYKDNNYYKEEAIKLEDDVKQSVKQIKIKKRHTLKGIKAKNSNA